MSISNPIVRPAWKVSLHGGHSGGYCDHAAGLLRDVLEAAVAQGFHTYGVSEHAPRLADHLLYDTERAMGWDVAKIEADFHAYAREIRDLAEEFADRLVVLRGFEIEVVPPDRYVGIMQGLRDQYRFDYIVGSVHFIDEVAIDGTPELFGAAVDASGGLEELAVRYYGAVAGMVEAMKPEVVGHLDLVRRNAPSNESVETPRIRRAAEAALEVIREHGAILDLNTAGYRKGLIHPYPVPWLLKRAHEIGVGVCFGDDSHGPAQVGAGIDDARQYLLEHGVGHVSVLTREDGAVVRKRVSLV